MHLMANQKHPAFMSIINIFILKISSEGSDYPNLMNIQMAELNPADPFEEHEVVQPANIKLNMQTCMNQRRVAVLKFPYSDIRTLPIQVLIQI
jgi:hypothetical protein